MTTEKTISEQLEELAALIGGKAWGADKGKPRIYLQSGRRDMKIFFDFPDAVAPSYLGGDRFCCFIDECGQSPKWYASQKRKMLEHHWKHGLAIMVWQVDAEELARRIMRADGSELTAAEVDVASYHLANGRVDEAEKELGPWLAGREGRSEF